MRAAIAYIRVSTDEQRLGPEAQRSTIEAWALREQVEILAWHVDQGVSGGASVEDRPALASALAALAARGATFLVAAKRDRFARDVLTAALLERTVRGLGARLATADGVASGDDPADEFQRAVLDAVAAFERAQIRARTRAALAVKRARGERISGALPFGYRLADDATTLLPDPGEQATIARVRALRGQGRSYQAIANVLTRAGIRSRNGTPLKKKRIASILAK